MNDITIRKPDGAGALIPADLIAKARDYAKASKSESTLRCYRAVWTIFTTWCERHQLEPLPASAETLCAYIADQGERLRPSTIKKHLAAVSQVHQVAGCESPTKSEIVRLTMQGLSRTKGTAPNPKRALRVEHVKKMANPNSTTKIEVRDRAVILVGMFTGLRRSEVASLDVGDLEYEPEGIVVTINRSKRDQEGRGRKVPVPYGKYEATCPVRALRRWLSVSGIIEGPLFIRLDPAGHGERLSGKSIASIVKRAVSKAGLDPVLFGGHSLRRGFASETARAGASERDIAKTTGHASMQVLRGYIEEGQIFECAAGKMLDL